MVMSYTPADLEADLWSQTEFTKSDVTFPRPSIYLNKGRNGLFDSSSDEDEPRNGNFIGRGRAFKQKQSKVGSRMVLEDETRKQIREVSGLGYSNEVIEREIKRTQLLASQLQTDVNFVSPTSLESSKINSSPRIQSDHTLINPAVIKSANQRTSPPTISSTMPRLSFQSSKCNSSASVSNGTSQNSSLRCSPTSDVDICNVNEFPPLNNKKQ